MILRNSLQASDRGSSNFKIWTFTFLLHSIKTYVSASENGLTINHKMQHTKQFYSPGEALLLLFKTFKHNLLILPLLPLHIHNNPFIWPHDSAMTAALNLTIEVI